MDKKLQRYGLMTLAVFVMFVGEIKYNKMRKLKRG